MSTVNIPITSTAFVEISTAADSIIQNNNTTPILVAFEASLPTPSADAMVLQTGKALQKIATKPTGNVYARMAYVGSVGFVTVAE